MCCVVLRGLGKLGVWEGWECGRFSGFELRVFFSWGSVWRPRFPQEENSPKPEPQLKQKPCLAGWRCPKLGFWFVVGVFPGLMNCRGFFGLLFSYPFGLFIPRVLDT